MSEKKKTTRNDSMISHDFSASKMFSSSPFLFLYYIILQCINYNRRQIYGYKPYNSLDPTSISSSDAVRGIYIGTG